MSNAACPRFRLPTVLVYSAKLLPHIPGQRTLSPPQVHFGDFTRSRSRKYSFSSDSNGPVNDENRRRTSADRTAATGPEGHPRCENGRLVIIDDQDVP